jgi:hypothetical protein
MNLINLVPSESSLLQEPIISSRTGDATVILRNQIWVLFISKMGGNLE